MNNLSNSSTVPMAKRSAITRLAIDWFRLGIHLIGLLPAGELFYKWLSDQLTVNPIQFVEQFLGRAALNLLVVTLAVTPFITVTGWKRLGKHSRTLGLYSFLYFALHFLTFVVVDYGLDFSEIFRQITEKPFIIAGLLAGLLLLILAATSFKFWMKRLGKNWKRLHRSIYLIGGLVVLHYAWAVKGSLTTLRGDILRPLVMGLIVLLLLVLRLPPIRRGIVAIRQRIRLASAAHRD